jgi:hypothetical protein
MSSPMSSRGVQREQPPPPCRPSPRLPSLPGAASLSGVLTRLARPEGAPDGLPGMFELSGQLSRGQPRRIHAQNQFLNPERGHHLRTATMCAGRPAQSSARLLTRRRNDVIMMSNRRGGDVVGGWLWDVSRCHTADLAVEASQRRIAHGEGKEGNGRNRPPASGGVPSGPAAFWARASTWAGLRMIALGCRLARPGLVHGARANM